jgi:hypothetical protein
MANRFEFRVDVVFERSEGKFASREELAAVVQEALESANPGTVSAENGGEYETAEWEVEEIQPKKAPKKNVNRNHPEPEVSTFKNNTFGGDGVPVPQGKQKRTIGGRLR